jgi:hypothetical protein
MTKEEAEEVYSKEPIKPKFEKDVDPIFFQNTMNEFRDYIVKNYRGKNLT